MAERWTFEKEVQRKLVHVVAPAYIILYLVIFYFFGHKLALFAVAALLILILYFEYARIELKQKIPIIHYLWALKRKKERNKIGADAFTVMGGLICLAVFDLRIAIAAVLMALFGDMASALFGKRFGRTKIKTNIHEGVSKKAWEGVIAELVVTLLVGYFFIRLISDPTNGIIYALFSHEVSLTAVITIMALVATTAETMITKLEDNLLVPIITGFAGQITLFIVAALA